jgi:anti-sigma regulatory factor (Ser/Thr protein kinase)
VFTSKQLADVRPILVIADRLYRAGKMSLNCKLQLDLAFQEAVANSLEHGNLELKSAWKDRIDKQGIDGYSLKKRERLLDPEYANRSVEISIDFNGSFITIGVKDQGRGWRSKNIPARLPADAACHGRGLSIILASMDEVSFDDNGTRIIMKKRVG